METMEKLVKRFNRTHPGYVAELCRDSWEPKYTIYITEPVCGITARYVFESCKEFKEWSTVVVLD